MGITVVAIFMVYEFFILNKVLNIVILIQLVMSSLISAHTYGLLTIFFC